MNLIENNLTITNSRNFLENFDSKHQDQPLSLFFRRGNTNMRLNDVNFQILEEVISHLGPEFFSKDISEDPEMIREHQEFVDKGEDDYHAAVGQVITKYHDSLKVNEIEKDTPRGSCWKKV
jgi:hypothetical protein